MPDSELKSLLCDLSQYEDDLDALGLTEKEKINLIEALYRLLSELVNEAFRDPSSFKSFGKPTCDPKKKFS